MYIYIFIYIYVCDNGCVHRFVHDVHVHIVHVYMHICMRVGVKIHIFACSYMSNWHMYENALVHVTDHSLDDDILQPWHMVVCVSNRQSHQSYTSSRERL